MDSISALNVADNLNVNPGGNDLRRAMGSKEQICPDPSPLRLVAEENVNFFRYLKKLGLSDDPDLVILSSRNHYYYGENDLKSVRTIINLKKLNLIKHLDMFFNSLIRILPPNTNFIGYFSDSKSVNGNGSQLKRVLRLFDRFNNFLDSRTDRNMNKNEVSELLVTHGFKIIDMREIDGVTYFYSKSDHFKERPVIEHSLL